MPKSAHVGGQNPEFVLRDFQGMNVLAAREAIEDDELYWCENAIPVAPGNLVPVNTISLPLVTIGGETTPTYTMSFNAGGTDYIFVVFSSSGNGYVVSIAALAGTATKIINGSLTSGKTFAVPYNNQGLLIVDPNGYWDWNVTTANTLTPWINSISAVLIGGLGGTELVTSVAGGTTLKTLGLSGGTGGQVRANYRVISVTLNAAGSGYAVGDSLTLTDGNPTSLCTITVASVGGGLSITGITLASTGSYPGPVASNAGATTAVTGPTGNVVAGGTGTGATFTVKIQAFSGTVISPGNGYTNNFLIQDFINGTTTVITNYNLQTSGVIGGTSMATYAGRVWIGSGRVVSFTDINSYNSFGGAGGSFTISDSYLYKSITALFAANNYLYIFGDTSIDVLSNVVVTAGLTTFSRINVTASVGTSTPTSVFAYYRGICFYHSSGFYLLSGATPEKLSEKISGILQQITTSLVSPTVYGCQVLVQSELCAAFMFQFNDIFTQSGTNRTLVALFFRRRWWVAALGTLTYQGMVSLPNGGSLQTPGIATIYAWSSNVLYQAFAASRPIGIWIVKTKLWDGAVPLKEKQALNAALGALFLGGSGSQSQVTVDTETGSSTTTSMPLQGSPNGYQLSVEQVNGGGTQYVGLTVQGSVNVSRVDLIALRGKTERDFLQ
jgi:hypothetical protein